MDAIDGAGGDDGLGVEVMAGQVFGDLSVGFGQALEAIFCAMEFLRDESSWLANLRRRDDQDGRGRHAGLDGRGANLIYEYADSAGGGPGVVVRMAQLKIV